MKTKTESDKEVVVKVEGLSKKFCRSLRRSMFYGSIDIARSMLGIPYSTDNLRLAEFWALKDISFELKKGEVLGIIGVNGSGKSTLLRILNGIFPPDKGKVTVKGRIGALIAVGAGFHPHMTGRENIYLNGALLGMTKKEIDQKIDSIIEFADIGDFLEAPVSTYSSGMTVRLGFAIAIHCEPDILLIDEILSVGDISFRNKSLRRMAELRKKAKAIIFISHNLEQVRVLCDRVIVLHEGSIYYYGITHKACVQYEELTRKIRLSKLSGLKNNIRNFKARVSSKEDIEFYKIGILDKQGKKTNNIGVNEQLTIFYEFKALKNLDELYFSLGILNEKLEPCIWLVSNDNNKFHANNIKEGNYRLIIRVPKHHLVPSVYIPNISIRNSKTGETYERILPNYSFRVASNGRYLERGIIAVEEKWMLEKIK